MQFPAAARSVLCVGAVAKTLEELPIHAKAVAFCCAVFELLKGTPLGNDRDLHEQIGSAAASITANMKEGFEQPSDVAFIRYLFHAKASLAEVVDRLRTAEIKGHITRPQLRQREAAAEELARMLGGWIKYLAKSNFKDRGRHDPDAPRTPSPPAASKKAATTARPDRSTCNVPSPEGKPNVASEKPRPE